MAQAALHRPPPVSWGTRSSSASWSFEGSFCWPHGTRCSGRGCGVTAALGCLLTGGPVPLAFVTEAPLSLKVGPQGLVAGQEAGGRLPPCRSAWPQQDPPGTVSHAPCSSGHVLGLLPTHATGRPPAHARGWGYANTQTCRVPLPRAPLSEGLQGGSRMLSLGSKCGGCDSTRGLARWALDAKFIQGGQSHGRGLPLLWGHPPSRTWGPCHPHTPLSPKTFVSSTCSVSRGCLLGPQGTSPRSCGTRCPCP